MSKTIRKQKRINVIIHKHSIILKIPNSNKYVVLTPSSIYVNVPNSVIGYESISYEELYKLLRKYLNNNVVFV